MEYISGTIEKIIFQSPSSWYTVCDVSLDSGEAITIVGTMPYASVGEGILAGGEWITSKDYGRQLKVIEYKKSLPENKNSILRYLSSGAIKGIGAKTAKKIVDEYGEDSFDVIENHPDWLINISGISRKKAYEISFDFKEKSDVREIMTFSCGLISAENAIKIHKKWGKSAVGILKENPYALCSDHFGIGFKSADELAINTGMSHDNRYRIEAGIKYVLGVYASRDGHTYVKKDLLIDSVTKFIGVEKELVLNVLDDENGVNGVTKLLTENEPCVALNYLYFAEMNIAKKLKHINRHAISLDNANLEYVVGNLEARDGIEYAVMQKKAIFESLKNGVTVLTGGPGTGKTTVVKALLHIFNHLDMKCALCAPTGRAAKRMSEATGEEAKTIHRLLEVSPNKSLSDEPQFLRNSSNPLDAEVIIVDESSMIDVRLMSSLLSAIKTGARLILIGDIDQLPSVGDGNVLNDVIVSGAFSTVCLNEIFRQAKNSGIVMNAHKINKGEAPNLSEKYNDFFFISVDDEKIAEYIVDLCKNRLPKKFGNDIGGQIQVITPTKKGSIGAPNLNFALQRELNPSSPSKPQLNKGQSKVFRMGDKVMQTKNNYDIEWIDDKNGIEMLGTGVFNGDIGNIRGVNEDIVTVDFGGKIVEYCQDELDELDHSYAITVHKSQGSEYPIVIIPVSSACPPILMTRNLIYTALTRAEKMAILVGNPNVFFTMIENNVKAVRNTTLKKLLTKGE